MKSDKYFFNYELQPGLKRMENIDIKVNPKVSIITSFYNSYEYMWQTINCVLNQTFPYWEWIIVDDGSNNEQSLKYLEAVKNIDNRIKIYHKENEGLAKGRDYAITKCNTDYILPLDTDDLIEPTYIETLYWSMETNKEVSWAFTNSVGFGKYIYLADYDFDCEKMKTENQIAATALIRKNDILEVGGYGVAKRYVNEDWHLWLRMLASGKFPAQIGYYGFWYRRKNESLLTKINDKENEENRLRLRDLKVEADKIKVNVDAMIYPKVQNIQLEYNKLNFKDNGNDYRKCNLLYIIPYTGPDKKMYKIIKNKSKNNNIIIIGINDSEYSQYIFRQKYEKIATVFNLNTFIDKKYYLGFIEYIMKTRNIENVYVACEMYKEEISKIIPNFETIRYNESKFLYELYIKKYNLKQTILVRAIRKIIRAIEHKVQRRSKV